MTAAAPAPSRAADRTAAESMPPENPTATGWSATSARRWAWARTASTSSCEAGALRSAETGASDAVCRGPND